MLMVLFLQFALFTELHPECWFMPPCRAKDHSDRWLNAVHYSKARWDVHDYSYTNSLYKSPQIHGNLRDGE